MFYILTRSRVGKQITLNNLPPSVQRQTFLVCPSNEQGQHAHQHLCPPDTVRGVGPTRQWIVEYARQQGQRKIFMMDDDLNFNVRIGDETTKLRKLTSSEELLPMFDTLLQWLDDYAAVGVSTRQGNNTVSAPYVENTRILRFFGINTASIESARFDRLEVMEDFDFLLQLLRVGKPNRVLYTYTQDQPMSGAAGGCSDYRTPEVQRVSAFRLQDKHPEFVQVTEKKVKKGWFGDDSSRTDVIIYWKKAYKSSFVR